jgi:hypothetical protein
VIRHQKTIVLGTAHYSITAGHRLTVKLRLSTAGLGALTHTRQHRVNARLTVTVAGGHTLTMNVVLVMVRVHFQR